MLLFECGVGCRISVVIDSYPLLESRESRRGVRFPCSNNIDIIPGPPGGVEVWARADKLRSIFGSRVPHQG